MTFEEESRLFNQIVENSVKCKCSHSVTIMKADRKICSHCGNWVYRTPMLEFKYKLKETTIRNGKERLS